jgi:hypothetical protein
MQLVSERTLDPPERVTVMDLGARKRRGLSGPRRLRAHLLGPEVTYDS